MAMRSINGEFKVDAVKVASFRGEPVDVYSLVERWAEENDYAVGPPQRNAPRAMMRPREDYQIAKWKNLSRSQRQLCHGWVISVPGGKEIWQRSFKPPRML